MRSAIRTVLKRCDTRIVMRPSARPRPSMPDARRCRVPLEQRVLGLGVERRGRLVEHQQQRMIAHEAARQRELLPLAEAHFHALRPGRAELRLEPGAAADPRRRRARRGRPPPTTAGSSSSRGTSPTPTVCRALNSNRKKSWNAPASRDRHASAGMRASSTPSTRMRPLVGSVQPAQQLHERRLAGAVLADDRDDRAGRQIAGSRPRAPAGRCRDRRTTRARSGCRRTGDPAPAHRRAR